MILIVLGLVLSAIAGVLSMFRQGQVEPLKGLWVGLGSAVCITAYSLPVAYFSIPSTQLAAMWPYVLLDLLVAAIVAGLFSITESPSKDRYYSYSSDYGFSPSWGFYGTVLSFVVFGIYAIFVINTDVNSTESAKASARLVHVVTEKPGQIPDTDTNHMVIVSEEVATSKANQTMSSGAIGQQGLNTYFNLGDATEQSVDNHMWYVFQLVFDGAINKYRQHAIVPGYIMVDAENPDAQPVERIGKDAETGVDYTMRVSIDGGQSQDVVRYVYANGYSGYYLEDPTLEIADNGHPYFTITLAQPAFKWGYEIPVGVLVVDANNGAIKRYDADKAPDWVDRVYSANTVTNMMNWWGQYAYAPFNMVGGSNANRYQVSKAPVLVYAKDGHPTWRLLMTSFNNDTSANWIVLFDAHDNEARIYKTQPSVSLEDPVLHSFNSASGIVASSHLEATDLTLHKIYGQLTWVVSYITTGDNGKATFQGVGLLNAYDTNGAGVIFGKSKEDALNQYQTQLANPSNNNAPNENATAVTVTGTLAGMSDTVEGGQTYVYFFLDNDRAHVYRGVANQESPELLFAKVGDPVVIKFLQVAGVSPVRNISSFDDTKLSLTVG